VHVAVDAAELLARLDHAGAGVPIIVREETVLMGKQEGDPVDVARRGYDALSLLYRADDADPDQYVPWIAELVAILGEKSRVLDLGCGCGVPVARDLAAAGHDVTGIDVSEVQIQRARHLAPNAIFVRDAVIALYSVIHLPLSAQPILLSSIAD